jgi:hypothetical protein
MGIQRRRVWWLIAVVFVAAASYGRHTAGAQGGTVAKLRSRTLASNELLATFRVGF